MKNHCRGHICLEITPVSPAGNKLKLFGSIGRA